MGTSRKEEAQSEQLVSLPFDGLIIPAGITVQPTLGVMSVDTTPVGTPYDVTVMFSTNGMAITADTLVEINFNAAVSGSPVGQATNTSTTDRDATEDPTNSSTQAHYLGVVFPGDLGNASTFSITFDSLYPPGTSAFSNVVVSANGTTIYQTVVSEYTRAHKVQGKSRPWHRPKKLRQTRDDIRIEDGLIIPAGLVVTPATGSRRSAAGKKYHCDVLLQLKAIQGTPSDDVDFFVKTQSGTANSSTEGSAPGSSSTLAQDSVNKKHYLGALSNGSPGTWVRFEMTVTDGTDPITPVTVTINGQSCYATKLS